MSLSLNGSGGIFGLDQGLNVTGVGTFQTLNVTDNLTVDGVLTYEDVTNIDSIGVVTARSGLHVTGGKVLINSTATNSDAQLLVKGADKLHPALKLDGLSANGFSLLGDEYQTDESQFTMGLAFSGASLVTGWGVKVSTTANDTYLSSQDTYSTKHNAIKHDGNGWRFLSNSTSQTVTTDSEVSLTERIRISADGDVGINESSPDNKLHITTDSATAYSDSTNNTSNLTNALLKLENTNGTDDSGVNNYVGIQFSVASGASSTAQLQYVRTGNNSGSFELKARNASSTMPNLVSIGSSGAVTLPAQERFKARKQGEQGGTDNASLWVDFTGSAGTVDYDTHSGWSESDGWYEIQNDGYFMIYATVLVTSTTSNSLRDYQMAICEYDDTSNTALAAFTARASTASDDDTHSMQATFLGNLTAGRKIRIRAFANTDTGNWNVLDDINDGVGGAGLDVNGLGDKATQLVVVKLG